VQAGRNNESVYLASSNPLKFQTNGLAKAQLKANQDKFFTYKIIKR
jgi:hypothetical protein